MEKEIISSRQFMIITLLFSIGTAILILPASVTTEAKQDAWIAAIIGVVLSLLIIKLFVTVGKRTPTLTFVEANEKILGRFFGKFTSIGFILIALLSAGELLYFIGIFMKTEIMPETPTTAFAFLFSIIIIYAAFLGIEVFARSAEILFPIFILIFIFFVICISPSIKIENLQPIMETPKKSIFFSMILFISLFSFPLAMLLTIFPSAVNVQKSAQKGFYIGAIIGGIVLVTIITLCILVLGPANTASRTFPSYSLAQRISLGNFLQRIEVIMATMWIISIFIRTFMYFYAAVIGIAQICKINNHRPLIFPLGMIILGLSQIVHPNIIHSDIYNREIWPIYSFVFMVFLPLVLLIVAKIRKINGNQGNNTCSTQNESGSNNGNSTQSAASNNSSQSNSSSNGGNATQGENKSNNGNSTQSDSSSTGGNSTQNESNCNNGNSTQNESSSNNGNSTQSDSSSNNGNSTQSDSSSTGGNSTQNESNCNNANSTQSDSSSTGGNSTQNESNCNNGNSTQNDSSSNNGNSIQNDSSSNNGNSTQSDSSSNNGNSTQSDSSSNSENPSPSKSDNASSNTTQNDSDTGNNPNSDKNKDSPES